jgi:peptidyl-prolyl cis-trans isomerase B (cyclophilin B)
MRSRGALEIEKLPLNRRRRSENLCFSKEMDMTKVLLSTSHGEITLDLDQDRAPITVENFLQYVDAGHYDGTIFHRVIADFMIQGGGFDAAFNKKATQPAIENEAHNGLTNDRGTVAMARTSDVNSATAQFFINVKDNGFLNHQARTPQGYGYAVFGRVEQGMDVVDQIRGVATGAKGSFAKDCPLSDVVIHSARRIS